MGWKAILFVRRASGHSEALGKGCSGCEFKSGSSGATEYIEDLKESFSCVATHDVLMQPVESMDTCGNTVAIVGKGGIFFFTVVLEPVGGELLEGKKLLTCI